MISKGTVKSKDNGTKGKRVVSQAEKNIYKGLFLEIREKRNYIVGMKNQRI